jgi:hypothetical protein
MTKTETRLNEFQLKRVKIMTEAIRSLSFEEKEYLWQRIRDSYVQMLGIDPAMMADFYPKMQGSEFNFDNLNVPGGSCIGMVEVARGKIKPDVKEQAKVEGQNKKDAKSPGKPQEKVNEKQAKDKKK